MNTTNLLLCLLAVASTAGSGYIWGRYHGLEEGRKVALKLIEIHEEKFKEAAAELKIADDACDQAFELYTRGYENCLTILSNSFKPRPLTIEEITPRK